jgi:hypothetical protein
MPSKPLCGNLPSATKPYLVLQTPLPLKEELPAFPIAKYAERVSPCTLQFYTEELGYLLDWLRGKASPTC